MCQCEQEETGRGRGSVDSLSHIPDAGPGLPGYYYCAFVRDWAKLRSDIRFGARFQCIILKAAIDAPLMYHVKVKCLYSLDYTLRIVGNDNGGPL